MILHFVLFFICEHKSGASLAGSTNISISFCCKYSIKKFSAEDSSKADFWLGISIILPVGGINLVHT